MDNKNQNKPSAKKEALAKIDELEITPLSDEELDSVAGGYTDNTTASSCSCCTAGATNQEL
jgi:hypothetical protein